MLSNTKKNKRRRYIRYAIALEALVVIDTSTSIRCVIMDFCTGGLFLGFSQTHDQVPLHKHVKIQFSIRREHGLKNFEVYAVVVHTNVAGLGVAIENMPPAVFEALKNEANNRPVSLLHDRRGTKPTNPKLESFKQSFKQILIEKLSQLLTDFFDAAGTDLEKANEHFELFSNRSAFDDLVTTLRLNRDCFISEICSAVMSKVDGISDFDRTKPADVNTCENTLSLIEKEDFEDWLKISDIIRKLNKHYEQQLYRLTTEFSRVFGIPTVEIHNPIIPAIICDNFHELLLQFNLSADIKEILYKTFEQTFIDELSILYTQAEVLLLKQESAGAGQTDNKSNKSIDRQQALTSDEPTIPPLRTPRHSTAPDGKRSQRLETPSYQSDHQIAQITEKLLDLLKETPTASPTIGKPDFSKQQPDPVERSSRFSADEIVAALSNLQNNSAADQSPLFLDSAELEKRLRHSLANVDEKPKQLADGDVRQLEVYGRFFETLVNDLAVSSDTRSYLEKLHLPLLSLPLHGKGFLDSDSNPARNILNQLAVLESAVKHNRVIKNTPIKDKVDELISRINREAATNPDVFSEVEQELNVLTSQVTKSKDANVRRIVESYEGRQKLEMARHAIQQEVDKRIAGKAVPSIIQQLLQSGWQDLLVFAELNHDNRLDEIQNYLRVIDDLNFWLYEQESMLNIQSASIEKTLAFVEQNLGSVCSNVFQRNSIIEELRAVLLGEGKRKIRKAMKTVKIAPVVPPPEDASIQTAHNEYSALVEQLQVGDWLMFSNGSEEPEPMKLIWKGTAVPVFVFVNHDGLNKRELNKTELTELFRSGAANKTDNLDVPLTDRATNLMLQKMYDKLIFNATHDAETQLLTRDEFVKLLKNELPKAGGFHHVLCHVAVMDFRVLTNICGTRGGKHLLKKLTDLMARQLRKGDLFARIGDISFAILFRNCSGDEGYELSKKLMKLIGESHFQWREKSFAIGVSMGLVPFNDQCYDVHQCLQQADSASISAEQSGQNRILMFTNDDTHLKQQHKLYEWMGHIDNVFSQNRLFARCQMIAPIQQESNAHPHYEILLGVTDEAGAIIPPDHFIPAVERCQRMPEIDRWVINNVLDWVERNRSGFEQMDGFSINLSGQSINSEEFLDFLKECLASCNVPLNKLTFEITETVAAENVAFTRKFIQAIKEFGCKFSLDDFGSGYSSYSYLKNLNVDYLKIDGAFVKDIANNQADIAIVKSMNEIAHSLGLKTIAEYVENDQIKQILKDIGVDYAQGYGIQKPILLNDLDIDPHF